MSAYLPRPIARYGFAVLVSGVALLLHLTVDALGGPGLPDFITFYPAVMLAATVYGLGPGVLATVTSALMADYWTMPPMWHLTPVAPIDILNLGIFVGMGIFMSLVAERYHRAHKRATDYATDLAAQAEKLRVLALEVTRAEQRERQRLAAILHDDLQQLLVGAKFLLGTFAQAADPKVQTAGRDLEALINQCLRCSRSLTEQLSPPILHRGELIPALEWLVKWMAETHHFTVKLESAPTMAHSPEITFFLFQAIRELLFNAVKHARVQSAAVEVAQRDARVQVRVSDAGAGFDPAQLQMAGGSLGGFGLFSLRERLEVLGGRLQIDSAPGRGSRFTITLPFPQGTTPAPAEEQPH